VRPLETMLVPRSKEGLVTLIGQMIKRDPDLMSVVESPAATQQGRPMDLEAYRRRVQRALRADGTPPGIGMSETGVVWRPQSSAHTAVGVVCRRGDDLYKRGGFHCVRDHATILPPGAGWLKASRWTVAIFAKSTELKNRRPLL
jgi:hypothetical protein